MVRFSRTEGDGRSILAFGLSLKLMHSEATEPEELGDRVNPDNNIIRKDTSYDKGISDGSGDCVWRPRNAPQARKLQQALYSGKSRTRDKANHQLMLAKSVSMGNLSTGRRVRRVGPAEMVELNDESSQIQSEKRQDPGTWKVEWTRRLR